MATDDFNRSNETPLAAPWVNSAVAGDLDSQVNLVSNAVRAASAAALSYYAGAASSGGQYSEVVSLGRDGAPSLRFAVGASAFNGYVFSCTGGTATMYKVTNGTYSSLGTTGSTGVAGSHTYKITASASTLTGYVDSVVEATPITDSTYTTGQPGINCGGAGHELDSWNGGDLVTTLATPIDIFDPIPFMSNQRI